MAEARKFPVEVALSVTTGVLLCEFSKVHEAYEFLTGGPVWTHEMGHRPFVEMVRNDVLRQAPALLAITADGVSADNWRAWLADVKRTLPATVTLEPIPDYGRTKSPLETLEEMLPVPSQDSGAVPPGEGER